MKTIITIGALASTILYGSVCDQTISDNIDNISLSKNQRIDNINGCFSQNSYNGNINLIMNKNEEIVKLISHKGNYILPAGYDTRKHNDSQMSDRDFDYNRQQKETKFQISFKVPIAYNMFGSNASFYVAYTQKAMFQNYNQNNSAPFRDINHNPEAFVDFDMNYYLPALLNSKLTKVRVTVSHESNGQALPNSRSWNYNSIETYFTKNKNIDFGINAWIRWSEEDKSRNDPTRDDNPDLIDRIGSQKYWIKYRKSGYVASLSYQNDIFDYSTDKGNVSLELLAPTSFTNSFKWMFQYFHGYGESLIDYNEKVNKIYFGISISDWGR